MVGCDQDTVSEIVRKSAELPDSVKPVAAHLTDFDAPLYNVWKQQTKTPGVSHFGNSEVRSLSHVSNSPILSLATARHVARLLYPRRDRRSGGVSTIDD